MIARSRTMDALNARIVRDGGASIWQGTTLASINEDALLFAESEWPKYYSEDVNPGFSKTWSKIWSTTSLQPSNFNIAVWQSVGGRDILQGLAVGNTSEGKRHITLNWVERYFGPEYTRFGVLIPILHCLEEYAALVGSERVLIKNPVDASKYERYGYASFDIRKSASSFLSKEVHHG